MIRGGFLSEADRKALIALARDGLAAGRVTRCANALAVRIAKEFGLVYESRSGLIALDDIGRS